MAVLSWSCQVSSELWLWSAAQQYGRHLGASWKLGIKVPTADSLNQDTCSLTAFPLCTEQEIRIQ
jgi:hypothetical protein